MTAAAGEYNIPVTATAASGDITGFASTVLKVTVESPDVPVIPDTPESSDTPVTPDKPESDDTPVTPDKPESDDTPVIPDKPDTPDTPDTPDIPDGNSGGDTPATPEPEKTELTEEQKAAQDKAQEELKQETAETAKEAEKVAQTVDTSTEGGQALAELMSGNVGGSKEEQQSKQAAALDVKADLEKSGLEVSDLTASEIKAALSAAGSEGDFFFVDEAGNPVSVVSGDASKMKLVVYLEGGKTYNDAFITTDATSEDQKALNELSSELASPNKDKDASTSSKDSGGCDAGLGLGGLLAFIPALSRKRR